MKKLIAFLFLVLFLGFSSISQAKSLPVYEGNVNDIINVVRQTVNVYEVSSIKLHGRISTYCIFYGTHQKHAYQKKKNSVYIHMTNDNKVDYVKIFENNGDTDIDNNIILLISPVLDQVAVPWKSRFPENVLASFSKKANRYILITIEEKYKMISADDGNYSASNGRSGTQYEWDKENCSHCRGSGSCSTCGGSGREEVWGGDRMHTLNCRSCGGTGTCRFCGGSGKQ
ncbi:MAG: hypothetical protein J6O13_07015 [Selenomonas sp.]|nr:hypothetical protein [Selenomonas sp.]